MKLTFDKLLLIGILLLATPAFSQISLSKTKYHQNFDSLVSAGTGNKMPYGWYFNTGSTVRTTYAADSGNNAQAGVYSYGNNSNRALGTLGRTGTVPAFWVYFVNSSSATITSITVAFTTEQWRVASATGRIDTTKCELSTDATSLTNGTWSRQYALDLLSISSGSTGYRIATDPLYQSYVKATIKGLSIKSGATFWLRWTDIIVTGANDGLAMDDFSMITTVTQKVPEISFATNFDVATLKMDSIKVVMNIIDTNSKAATVKVNINSSTSTAKSGTDVLYSGGNYTFSAKKASPFAFYIKIKHDTTTKKTKYLNIYLTSVSNAVLYDSLMTIKIFNKDSTPPVISYPISSAKKLGTNGLPDTTLYGYWHGVVTSVNFSQSGLFFTITDKTGSIAVIAGYNKFKYFPTMGDTVRVKGKVGSLNYLEYISVDSLKKFSSGNPVPNPTNVFTLAENTESAQVRIANKVSLVNAAAWDTTGGSAAGGFAVQVRATGGPGGAINVFISKYTDLYNTPAPKYPFYITGINIQNSKTPNNGYYLFPRFQKDIVQVIPPHYNISQIKGFNKNTGRADSVGVSCFLKGIIQSGNIGTTALSYSLYDFSGAITVVNAKTVKYLPRNGDSIMVLGTVGQTNGLTIITVDSVNILARNQTTKAATVVTKLDEVSESDLVQLKNLSLVDYLLWDTIATANKVSFTVQATDGTNTYNVQIIRSSDVYFMPAPKYKFNLTGIGSQNDPSNRPLTNYLIIPRNTQDIEKIVNPSSKVPEYKIRQVKAADSINTYCYLRGVAYSKNLGSSAFGFALKDSTGAISVVLKSGSATSYSPAIGDSVRVRGFIKQSSGLTLISIDSAGKLATSTTKFPGLVSTLSENTESNFVILQDVQLVNQAEWDTTGGAAKGGITVRVYTTNNDTIPVRLASVNDIFGQPAPTGKFNIAGIGLQIDVTQPYLQGYYLLPRSKDDLSTGTVTNSIAPVSEKGHVVNVYPNPSAGNVYLNAPEAIQKVEVMNTTGQTIQVYYPNNANVNLQMKDIPAGIYLIHITANGINETEKLIRY